MSNNERLKYSRFEGDFVIDNPDVEEKEQVTVTQSELKEIFQKLNLSGKQILNIDKEVFEKLEFYMKQVERLNEYKREIARKELEKYIVPVSKITKKDGSTYSRRCITYVNKKQRGKFDFYAYTGSCNCNVLKYKDFKYFVAGTKYGYLSDAFSENCEDSQEDIYIDIYLWVLDKDGRAEMGKTLFFEENVCKIYFPKK